MYDTCPGIQSPYRHHVKVNGTGNTTRYTHSTYHAKTILQDELSLTAYLCSLLGHPRSPRSVYGPDRHELPLEELLVDDL